MSKQEKAIGSRVVRLSELRKKLVIAKGDLDRAVAELQTATERMKTAPNPDGVMWPSPERLRGLRSEIKDYQQEAGKIIRGLAGLGVDAGLFKLNGEDAP